jgi:hypothetical protein
MSETIKRAQHNASENWFLLRRQTMQDDNLSFEARGMLAYLLSKPDNWEIRIGDLMKAGKCGRQKAYRIMHELEENLYLKRGEKYQDESGKWKWSPHVIYEEPHGEWPREKHVVHDSSTSSPEPCAEKPHTVNHHILQNTENRIQKKINTLPPPPGDGAIQNPIDKTNHAEKQIQDAKLQKNGKPKTAAMLMYDAIVNAFRWNPDDVPEKMRGVVNHAGKELRDLSEPIKPQEIPDLYQFTRKRLSPGTIFTPAALPKSVPEWRKQKRGGGERSVYDQQVPEAVRAALENRDE